MQAPRSIGIQLVLVLLQVLLYCLVLVQLSVAILVALVHYSHNSMQRT